MPAHNVKQAHLIPSARFIKNRNGTAPGWWAEKNDKHIVCMPGPPGEKPGDVGQMRLDAQLQSMIDTEVTITRNIKTLGLGEASVDEIISEYFGPGESVSGDLLEGGRHPFAHHRPRRGRSIRARDDRSG